jgi:hypothetical protein
MVVHTQIERLKALRTGVILLAGIDLTTGKRSSRSATARASSSNLKLLDAAYPALTAIKLILDNHSAHISNETKAWLATRNRSLGG